MDNRKQLAIVIPAYKATFLPAALDSIAAQTSKDFALYIGDDCSPYDLGAIVDRYRDRMDLVYHRFDANLGGRDLVAQWERCIDLTQGEPWLWLFSDDDVMEANCVEEFYKVVKKHPAHNIYHFDINVIDGHGNLMRSVAPYPAGLTAWDFCKKRSEVKLVSYVVEYIFRRDTFMKYGRFQNFDLAWGSDVATITKLIGNKTLGIINSAHVNWRYSSENISPDHSAKTSIRKLLSVADYTDWINRHFFSHGKMNHWLLVLYLKRYKRYAKNIEPKDRRNIENSFITKMGWDRYAILLRPLFRTVSWII